MRPGSRSGIPSWVRWLVYGIGGLMVVGSLWYMAWASQRIWAANDWPSVMGRVVSAEIRVDTSTESSGNRSRTVTSYVPEISYTYEVDGRAWRSDDLWLVAGTGYSEMEEAEEAIAGYPVGGTVEVFYDPEEPGDAALLYDDLPWGMLILTGMGLAWLAVGHFFLNPRRDFFNTMPRPRPLPVRPHPGKPSRWPVIVFLIVFVGTWAGAIYLIVVLD